MEDLLQLLQEVVINNEEEGNSTHHTEAAAAQVDHLNLLPLKHRVVDYNFQTTFITPLLRPLQNNNSYRQELWHLLIPLLGMTKPIQTLRRIIEVHLHRRLVRLLRLNIDHGPHPMDPKLLLTEDLVLVQIWY